MIAIFKLREEKSLKRVQVHRHRNTQSTAYSFNPAAVDCGGPEKEENLLEAVWQCLTAPSFANKRVASVMLPHGLPPPSTPRRSGLRTRPGLGAIDPFYTRKQDGVPAGAALVEKERFCPREGGAGNDREFG